MLGVDYGTKKIGLALGIGKIVSPYCVIETHGKPHLEEAVADKLVCIVKNENISKVIIGRPGRRFRMSEISGKIEAFAGLVRTKIPSRVGLQFVDESGSSKEGLKNLINLGISEKKRKEDHGSAACIILKRWMDWNL